MMVMTGIHTALKCPAGGDNDHDDNDGNDEGTLRTKY